MPHPTTTASCRKVTLFVQCLVDAFQPQVAQSMVDIFSHLGLEVECPTEQTCCGQMAFNAGHRKEAAVAARHFVTMFEDAEVIVCPSGSCTAMVVHHYPQLLATDHRWAERAKRVAAKTYEFTQFVVDALGVQDLGSKYAGTATYHDSCHLARSLGIREQPRLLLNNISGLNLVEMEDSDRCCGFGGVFSIKYPEISSALLQDKVTNIRNSGAELVVGCDVGCLMNIQGMLHRQGSRIQTMHIAQLLGFSFASGKSVKFLPFHGDPLRPLRERLPLEGELYYGRH
ncbi:MAG: (Fe-S)-binding protein [Desulfovermiculus sp.]|nr:(Fe-S)-binding protein [Desulfovermiculus sp.]